MAPGRYLVLYNNILYDSVKLAFVSLPHKYQPGQVTPRSIRVPSVNPLTSSSFQSYRCKVANEWPANDLLSQSTRVAKTMTSTFTRWSSEFQPPVKLWIMYAFITQQSSMLLNSEARDRF